MKYWLLLASALLLANAKPEEEEVICVGGMLWGATLDETQAIEQVPVPERYKQLSMAPCFARTSNGAALVQWHLRFGDERSATSALAYLEQDYLTRIPAPKRYEHELKRAWRAALPDLRRASRIKQPEGLTYSAQWRFMEGSRPIQRLQRLVFAREDYLFLAREYLRSADEFGSSRLLNKADRYLQPVLAGTEFLGANTPQSPEARVLAIDLHAFRIDDPRLRAAILRARLTGSAHDLSTAVAMADSLEKPLDRRIAETAFSGGDDFCDISSGWSQSEKLKEACEADDSSRDLIVSYWVNRATLDLIAKPNLKPTFDGSDALTIRLLEGEQAAESARCCGASTVEDLTRVLLARANARATQAESVGDREEFAAISQLREALGDLQMAERLAPPYEQPKRFQRIAQHWLAVWDRVGKLEAAAAADRPLRTFPQDARYAVYLRQVLANLEEIAEGKVAP